VAAANQSLEPGSQGRNLNGLVEVGGLQTQPTCREQDPLQGQTGPQPIARTVTGADEHREQGSGLCKRSIPFAQDAAEVEAPHEEPGEGQCGRWHGQAITEPPRMHPGSQLVPPGPVGLLGGVSFAARQGERSEGA